MNKNDFERLKKIGEIVLTEWANGDGTPVKVSIHLDEAKQVAFQFDERNARYRSADASIAAMYGDWKKM